MTKKRIHFLMEQETWEKLKEIFPYTGEITAFFNRCAEAAVATQVPESVMRQVEKLIDATHKKSREEGERSG